MLFDQGQPNLITRNVQVFHKPPQAILHITIDLAVESARQEVEAFLEDTQNVPVPVEALRLLHQKSGQNTVSVPVPKYLLTAYELAKLLIKPKDAVVFWDAGDAAEARKLKKRFSEELKAETEGAD